MQNRQAATAYMGGYYRITVVVAMATSCASGMNRFVGQEFLIKEKVCLRCSLLYIFISVFTSDVLKKHVTTPVISVVLLVNCQQLQAGRSILKFVLLIFQITVFGH